MAEQEIWKTIKNYPNYQISNRGDIRNVTNNKLLKGRYLDGIYLQVTLCKKGKRKSFLVRHLHAETFETKTKEQLKYDKRIEKREMEMNKIELNIKPIRKSKSKYPALPGKFVSEIAKLTGISAGVIAQAWRSMNNS